MYATKKEILDAINDDGYWTNGYRSVARGRRGFVFGYNTGNWRQIGVTMRGMNCQTVKTVEDCGRLRGRITLNKIIEQLKTDEANRPKTFTIYKNGQRDNPLEFDTQQDAESVIQQLVGGAEFTDRTFTKTRLMVREEFEIRPN